MNRSVIKPIALLTIVCMLCVAAVGCQAPVTTPDTPATPVGNHSSVIPSPTRVPVDSDNLFIGSWTVSAQKATFTAITFDASGSIVMSFPGGNKLGGYFYLTGDDAIELALTSSSIKGTYVVSGNTVTLTTDADVIVLTKQ